MFNSRYEHRNEESFHPQENCILLSKFQPETSASPRQSEHRRRRHQSLPQARAMDLMPVGMVILLAVKYENVICSSTPMRPRNRENRFAMDEKGQNLEFSSNAEDDMEGSQNLGI